MTLILDSNFKYQTIAPKYSETLGNTTESRQELQCTGQRHFGSSSSLESKTGRAVVCLSHPRIYIENRSCEQ